MSQSCKQHFLQEYELITVVLIIYEATITRNLLVGVEQADIIRVGYQVGLRKLNLGPGLGRVIITRHIVSSFFHIIKVIIL